MGVKAIASVVLLFLFARVQAGPATFDVTNFGAKPNGEISQALLSAWKQACAATSPSLVLIPAGTYSLKQVELNGHCKAPIEVKVDGILKAPTNPNDIPSDKQWVTVNYVEYFTLSGSGTFDGQGQVTAWKLNDCNKNKNCPKLPYNLSFNFLVNSTIRGVTSLNSKAFHVNVNGCNNLTFNHFTITTPEDSPNTDGIHIGRSKGIYVLDSVLQTGDDCVSVGDGTEQLHVERVTCGPGHGISVGSLGKFPNEKPVVGVFVKNCTLINTMNGVRIKTWPNSYPGIVTYIHFEDIIMDKVSNPVLIEQEYCPSNQCTKEKPSLVKVSKVVIKNIKGTSATPVAVKLACSPGVPCEDVEVSNINLTYNGNEGPAKNECSNVKPTFFGPQNPPACVV